MMLGQSHLALQSLQAAGLEISQRNNMLFSIVSSSQRSSIHMRLKEQSLDRPVPSHAYADEDPLLNFLPAANVRISKGSPARRIALADL